MKEASLRLVFASDTHLGRGDGVAGFIDSELQHDQYGCPFLGGRTLKGLLQEECANLLYNLGSPGSVVKAAAALFGSPGSGYSELPVMRVGPANLPDDLRKAIILGIKRKDFTSAQILSALTTIRQMTAQDYERMAPKKQTLRSIRLVRRGAVLISQLSFERNLQPEEVVLLAACVAGLRRLGGGRNRGHGQLQEAVLLDEQSNPVVFKDFSIFPEVTA